MINTLGYSELNSNIGFIILILLLAFFVMSFVLYINFKNKIKTNVIFDLSVMIFFFGIVITRCISLIDNLNYYRNLPWRIIPFEESINQIYYVKVLPWELFNFFDRSFYIWYLPTAMCIAAFFIYLNSNKAKRVFDFMDKIIPAIAIAQILIYTGILVLKAYFGSSTGFVNTFIPSLNEFRFNIAFVEIFVGILVLIVSLLIQRLAKKEGISTTVFLLLNLISLNILDRNIDKQNLDYLTYFYSLLVLVLPISFFLGSLRDYLKNKKNISRRIVDNNTVFEQKVYSDMDLERQKSALRRIKWFAPKKKK